MPRERLNVVDLFAGCGALSAGFAGADAADCRIVCANEMNPVAAESFRANHPDTVMISRDIRSVDSGEICALAGLKRGDVDAVVGGPPCQGFSTVGNREDDDPRNIMFLEFVRMVRELRPARRRHGERATVPQRQRRRPPDGVCGLHGQGRLPHRMRRPCGQRLRGSAGTAQGVLHIRGKGPARLPDNIP